MSPMPTPEEVIDRQSDLLQQFFAPTVHLHDNGLPDRAALGAAAPILIADDIFAALSIAADSLPETWSLNHDLLLEIPNGFLWMKGLWERECIRPVLGVWWSPWEYTPGQPDAVSSVVRFDDGRTTGLSMAYGLGPSRDGLQETSVQSFTVSFGDTLTQLSEQGVTGFGLSLLRLVATLLEFTAQHIVQPESQIADRPARRRYERRWHREPPPIQVVRLRAVDHGSMGEHGSPSYHVRWLVRGHWRNQWHPRLRQHHPRWIAPHVKGPEGAPLQARSATRVIVVDR